MNAPRDRVSQREASFLLRSRCGLTDRHARLVLRAGLVGEPHPALGSLLYDSRRLVSLLARRPLSEAELDAHFPHGVFVSRRRVNVDASDTDLRAAIACGWGYSPWTTVWLRVRIERHGAFPLVATVGGFVVAGANIEYVGTDGRLDLAEAGDWFEPLRERRLVTGPGRDWWIRGLDRPPAPRVHDGRMAP